MPADRMGTGFREKGELQLGAAWGALQEKKNPLVLSASWKHVHAHELSLHLHPPQVLIPSHPPSSDNPGATFSHSPPTPPGCHSPSITAVPTEQGITGALQEIEVPFGSQRSQRKHVTTWTLWAQYPSHTCGHIRVDHRHQHVDVLRAPLPSPLF